MTLRRLRIIAASLALALVTLLFLDFSGASHRWLGWLAKIQFLPSLLALNAGVVIVLLAVTFAFGRVYCSVVCPLGVGQDLVSWVRGRMKKNRFYYSPALTKLRIGVLGLGILAFAAGLGSAVSVLDPYGSYGRIASNLFSPLYAWGNNALAYLAARADSYAFYSVDVWLRNGATFALAAVTLGVVGFLAWKNGRTYCNALCPVGTTLGFVSRFAVFKPRFVSEKCTKCGLCARNCKSSCIDPKTQHIDHSRCVACMDCFDKCRHGALTFSPRKAAPRKESPSDSPTRPARLANSSRRGFLSLAGSLALASSLGAQESKVDGGLAVIADKKRPKRLTPIAPPGAQGLRNLAKHCTACQLCVSACPNGVLRASGDLATLMQPEVSYERGYCRPECTRCSEVCPAGAILPITKAEKSAIQVGHAVWNKDTCLVNAKNVKCGNCARHCPVGAIRMVPKFAGRPDSPQIPVVDIERCIGCGACENLCPVRPLSAIYVEGHERHRVV